MVVLQMRMTPPWTHISESLVLSETMGGRLGGATLLEYLWPCYRRCVTGSGFQAAVAHARLNLLTSPSPAPPYLPVCQM